MPSKVEERVCIYGLAHSLVKSLLLLLLWVHRIAQMLMIKLVLVELSDELREVVRNDRILLGILLM